MDEHALQHCAEDAYPENAQEKNANQKSDNYSHPNNLILKPRSPPVPPKVRVGATCAAGRSLAARYFVFCNSFGSLTIFAAIRCALGPEKPRPARHPIKARNKIESYYLVS